MPSTYTDNGLQKPGSGEQSGAGLCQLLIQRILL